MSRPLLADDPRQVGAWRLTARLGEGGFGVVYDGVRADGQRGAVKVMHRHLAGIEDYVTRFGREVALAQQVRGDHVARVLDHDLGAAPPYLVTEFVDGPTLHDEVVERGALAGDNLYALALALAEAISSIAGAGVVHRDLKPGNVLLTARTPVVVDFGIASAAGLERLTATGVVMGTSQFMAPEQFTGGDSSPAIDIFAWASVVHFAANGRAPFRDETGNASAVMYQVLHAEPEPGALAGPLAGLVAAAHAKDPRTRPTPDDLVARLVAFREPAAVDPVRTSAMLVERTWHLAPTPPPAPPPSAPPTPVAPLRAPARAAGPPAMPNVVYTPPRPAASPPRAQTGTAAGARPTAAPPARPTSVRPPPPPAPSSLRPPSAAPPPPPPAPGAPARPAVPATPARYPIAWLMPWAQRLPDFGKLGLLAAVVYLGVGQALDNVDDGVVPTGGDQSRAIDAWNWAWSLRPLVLFLIVGYVGQRLVRAIVGKRGLAPAEWRAFAAASSLLGMGLALVPIPATVVLGYGIVVLEPDNRLTVAQAVAAGTGALAMAVLAVVGAVFAVRAAVHLVQSLVGTVVWRG